MNLNSLGVHATLLVCLTVIGLVEISAIKTASAKDLAVGDLATHWQGTVCTSADDLFTIDTIWQTDRDRFLQAMDAMVKSCRQYLRGPNPVETKIEQIQGYALCVTGLAWAGWPESNKQTCLWVSKDDLKIK